MALRRKQGMRLGEGARKVANAKMAMWEDSRIDGTTKEQLIAFLSYLAVDGLKPKTVASYAKSMRKLAHQCLGKGFLYLQRRDVRQIIFAEQEKGYLPSTMGLLKTRFLRFQRWLREEHGYPADYPDHTIAGTAFHGGGRPVEFASVKIAVKQRPTYGPENMPDQRDVGKMVEATRRPRDRAMVAVLYESAARLGEFLALKLSSIEKAKHGWRLHIGNGKTGRRPVLLVNSGPYLAMWISQHPSRRSPEAPLWLTMRRPSGVARNGKRKSTPRRISANCVRSLLKNMGKRAGVGKRLNPHAFRHARATELAKHLKESHLRAYMGWSPGSAMPGIYVHISGRDTDDAILAAGGLKAAGFSKALDHPKTCATCSYANPSSARRCLKCERSLDTRSGTNGRQVPRRGTRDTTHPGESRRIHSRRGYGL